MSLNERKTEQLVRKKLDKLGYYSSDDIIVEEQRSDSPKIDNLLKKASKKGDGHGFPEFIIRSKTNTEFILIIECKASTSKHESKEKKQYDGYAVDGALWYASNLTSDYDVTAIGISGESKKEIKISHYLCLQNSDDYHDFLGDELLSFENYYTEYSKDPRKFNQDFHEILDYSQELNNELHSKKVKESQRSLLISGILIALKNDAFVAGYKKHKTAKQLSKNLVSTIVNELSNGSIPETKIDNLKQAYSFITTHTTLSNDKEFFENLIDNIDKKINSFLKTHKYFDTLGQFYIEFLRYANNDTGLGIVLTPPHITELYSDLANVTKDSIVIDNCCGTGGFLISAMKKMIQDSNGDHSKIENIKRNQILGAEFQDDIYALAVSNMIIHGDGKANIYHGDCFDYVNKINQKGTVGLLNPPYKSEKSDEEELKFILNNLEMLERNGKCLAIVPIPCALAQKGEPLELKKKLLKNHTLEAVMSMPKDLFHNSDVTVVTCTMLITAHVPHPKNKKTWFGYWRNDGFVKVKHKGRIDIDNKWPKIRKRWLNSFVNRKEIAGESVMQKITPKDEWCAEAFMDTDYSTLNDDDFQKEIRKYVAFNILQNGND